MSRAQRLIVDHVNWASILVLFSLRPLAPEIFSPREVTPRSPQVVPAEDAGCVLFSGPWVNPRFIPTLATLANLRLFLFLALVLAALSPIPRTSA